MIFAPDLDIINWYSYDIRNLTDDEYNKWYSMMLKDKKQRVDKFHFEDDKKRTVVGEMLVRNAICKKCSIAPENIVFSLKEHGKPYVKDLSVEFNVSHSGDIVVCALANRPVGIDIEQIRPMDLKVAKRICTKEELLFIFGHKPTNDDFAYTTDTQVLTRFFEIWTAKEAYVKCTGNGISSIKADTHKLSVQKFYFDNYVVAIYIE